MKWFYRARNFLFGSTSITVGHCFTRRGSSVLLTIGRKRAGLTPDGARMIADQLLSWAKHADKQGAAVATMKWVVVATHDVESAKIEWETFQATKTVGDNRTGEASAEEAVVQ